MKLEKLRWNSLAAAFPLFHFVSFGFSRRHEREIKSTVKSEFSKHLDDDEAKGKFKWENVSLIDEPPSKVKRQIKFRGNFAKFL